MTTIKSESGKSHYKIENTDQLISLMNVYMSDINQRDSMFWKQIFTYFFVTIFVIMLPELTTIVDVHETLPNFLFRMIGMGLALIFLFISHAYIARMKCLSDVYMDMIDMLPPDFRRKRVSNLKDDIWHKLFDKRMSTFMSWIMFILLEFVALVMLSSDVGLKIILTNL